MEFTIYIMPWHPGKDATLSERAKILQPVNNELMKQAVLAVSGVSLAVSATATLFFILYLRLVCNTLQALCGK